MRNYYNKLSNKFTFHNVSINSLKKYPKKSTKVYLHSTMFLLIHVLILESAWKYLHLHSTMFLLILPFPSGINPEESNLHSTMFLLIQIHCNIFMRLYCNLHSTMFLLIQSSVQPCSLKHSLFTFHNVSINS